MTAGPDTEDGSERPAAERQRQAITVSKALETATRRFAAAQIEGARRDARLLLSNVLPGGTAALLRDPERPLSQDELSRFEAAVRRREKREPVSRVIGLREFWSLSFKITPDTLDPRPDSETLIEGILERVENKSSPLRILDLGTGTGCLLLALLSELPAARGLGVDVSERALEVARENAQNLGLGRRADFEAHDWTDGVTGRWDIVLSNPPYIAEGEAAHLAPEVADYDPGQALIAGVDGLRDYRILIPGSVELLNDSGLLALEVGRGQADAVEAMLLESGLHSPWRKSDLAGVERCCFAVKVKK